MLAILDTNHYREFQSQSNVGSVLRDRLERRHVKAAISIITAEEVLRGRLAMLQPHRQKDRGVACYGYFKAALEGMANWLMLPWNEAAADKFDSLRNQDVNIDTMDLRIASIALVFDATVLTRNLKDFNRVPGLKFENWLD